MFHPIAAPWEAFRKETWGRGLAAFVETRSVKPVTIVKNPDSDQKAEGTAPEPINKSEASYVNHPDPSGGADEDEGYRGGDGQYDENPRRPPVPESTTFQYLTCPLFGDLFHDGYLGMMIRAEYEAMYLHLEGLNVPRDGDGKPRDGGAVVLGQPGIGTWL